MKYRNSSTCKRYVKRQQSLLTEIFAKKYDSSKNRREEKMSNSFTVILRQIFKNKKLNFTEINLGSSPEIHLLILHLRYNPSLN